MQVFPSLHIDNGLNATFLGSIKQSCVIALGLISVGFSEVGNCLCKRLVAYGAFVLFTDQVKWATPVHSVSHQAFIWVLSTIRDVLSDYVLFAPVSSFSGTPKRPETKR